VNKIDRQILKTLAYADIFDYALTREEIWRYLIEVSCTFSKFNHALDGLVNHKKIYSKQKYYTLPKRNKIISL
jgi:hypothetical protein